MWQHRGNRRRPWIPKGTRTRQLRWTNPIWAANRCEFAECAGRKSRDSDTQDWASTPKAAPRSGKGLGMGGRRKKVRRTYGGRRDHGPLGNGEGGLLQALIGTVSWRQCRVHLIQGTR